VTQRPDEATVEVWAAGGIVSDEQGRLLLAHRPRYDDWTLPKGKLDPGETLPECALREVHEETGYRCVLGQPAAASRYRDHKGRAKEVRYWHMTVAGGAFVANDEIDQIKWMSCLEARERLSYERDREILDEVSF